MPCLHHALLVLLAWALALVHSATTESKTETGPTTDGSSCASVGDKTEAGDATAMLQRNIHLGPARDKVVHSSEVSSEQASPAQVSPEEAKIVAVQAKMESALEADRKLRAEQGSSQQVFSEEAKIMAIQTAVNETDRRVQAAIQAKFRAAIQARTQARLKKDREWRAQIKQAKDSASAVKRLQDVVDQLEEASSGADILQAIKGGDRHLTELAKELHMPVMKPDTFSEKHIGNPASASPGEHFGLKVTDDSEDDWIEDPKGIQNDDTRGADTDEIEFMQESMRSPESRKSDGLKKLRPTAP